MIFKGKYKAVAQGIFTEDLRSQQGLAMKAKVNTSKVQLPSFKSLWRAIWNALNNPMVKLIFMSCLVHAGLIYLITH